MLSFVISACDEEFQGTYCDRIRLVRLTFSQVYLACTVEYFLIVCEVCFLYMTRIFCLGGDYLFDVFWLHFNYYWTQTKDLLGSY